MTPSWYCHSLLVLRAGKLKPYQAFNFSVMILLWKQARLWEVPEAISSIPVCCKRIKVSCKLEVWAAFLISTGCSALQKKNGARYVKIDSILFLYTTVKLNSSFPSPCREKKKEKEKQNLSLYTRVLKMYFLKFLTVMYSRVGFGL